MLIENVSVIFGLFEDYFCTNQSFSKNISIWTLLFVNMFDNIDMQTWQKI